MLSTMTMPRKTIKKGAMWVLFRLFVLLHSVKTGILSVVALAPSLVDVTPISPLSLRYCHRRQPQCRPLRVSPSDDGNHHKDDNDGFEDPAGIEHLARRRFLLAASTATAWATAMMPSVASAGELGRRITQAVTKSDLGISVRTSVVQGAQLADKLDGQWEKFSDTYGLGSERTKNNRRLREEQQQRAAIPDPQPLNVEAARKILEVSDEVFVRLLGTSPQALTARIQAIATSARPSFERSGVVFAVPNNNNSDQPSVATNFSTGPQFNFVVYAHFKAYSELILEQGKAVNFGSFRADFERGVGQRLVETLQLANNNNNNPAGTSTTSAVVLKNRLLAALDQTDGLGQRLYDLGLVSRVERNPIESSDDLQDFVDDALGDLVVSVSVDGDVTLQSQILLQEQGYRLYPNFNRFILAEVFRQAVQGPARPVAGGSGADESVHKVSVMDYYFDTNYNSDPDKFEVKQVLLNISIE